MNTANPYEPPQSEIRGSADKLGELRYVGFWWRVLASIIDTILIMMVTMPLLYVAYGAAYFESTVFVQGTLDVLLSYVFPLVAVLAFWHFKSATPGKMAVGAKIVDARTNGKPSTGQFIGRYFAYIPSLLALGLGCFWIGWDRRKQGWHDKLASTLVVKSR